LLQHPVHHQRHFCSVGTDGIGPPFDRWLERLIGRRRGCPLASQFLHAGADRREASLVSIRVLSVTPLRAGKLFVLASVEIDIDGIQIAIHASARYANGGTRIELPQFRDQSGALRPAITLPEKVRGPIGDAVIDELVERGLVRRFDVPVSAAS
jgi:stage V sporulation protein G